MDFQWIGLEKILKTKPWIDVEDSTWKSEILFSMFYVFFFYIQRPVQYQKTSWEDIIYDYDGLMRKNFILDQRISLNLFVRMDIVKRPHSIHSESPVGKGNWPILFVDKTMVKMSPKIKIRTFTQNFSLSIQFSVYFVKYCVTHLYS